MSELRPTPIIIIGSSAGGIDALTTLLSPITKPLAAPIVIAQHLNPANQSHLEAILARSSVAPVVIASDGAKLEPGTIYVIPSNRHAEITDSIIKLSPGVELRPIPSIDRLLTSAANDSDDQVIAVILTGAGYDGSAGAHAVHAAGGTVIVQDPITAAYPSMPGSLAANDIDIVAPLDQIGQILADLVDHAGAPPSADGDVPLRAVLERIQQQRGIDFSNYKLPTVARRLQRRMVATGTTSMAEYLDYLDSHPEEDAALISALLIKVTEFFRDPPVFDHIRDVILPALISRAASMGTELRIWSAGCATGEEPYSLGMLVRDLQRDADRQVPVRIFATDLDSSAIDFARRGLYSGASLTNVPAAMVERYFTPVDGMYEISKQVRDLVVFGHHDLIQRPPFPNTDLVLCRNVLIYFTMDLQDRVLQTIAYSLKEGGYLVLGRAETATRQPALFQATDRTLRIYQRTAVHLPLMNATTLSQTRIAPLPRNKPAEPVAAEDRGADSGAIPWSSFRVNSLSFGVSIIDRRYNILAIDLATRRLLGIHGLAVGEDFVHRASHVPSNILRNAIDTVIRTGEEISVGPLVTTDAATSEDRYLTFSIHPGIQDGQSTAERIMIVVSDVTSTVLDEQTRQDLIASVDRIVNANRELLQANQDLALALNEQQSSRAQFQVETENAQANAEETITLNEELQATNEELETLNEQSQATLEELQATNDELGARERELQDLSTVVIRERDLLSNILACMDDALLVIERDGTTLLSNQGWQILLDEVGGTLVPLDEDGVPISPDNDPRHRASRGEAFVLTFTTLNDGKRRWFEALSQPMQTHGLDASLLVIRDITDRSQRRLQDIFLAKVSHELRTPLTVMIGGIEMIRRQIPLGPEGEDMREFVQMVASMAGQQAKLVDDLLDASRIASGKMSLALDEHDLAIHVRDAVAAARLLADDRTFTCEVPDDPVITEVDGGRITQALLVLLRNAIDYSDPGTTIAVRLTTANGSAAIAVNDEGIGIEPETLTHIFDRFARTTVPRRKPYHGLGLGLHIAREIALAHGGDITVESTLGKGSTFTLTLPLRTPAGTSAG